MNKKAASGVTDLVIGIFIAIILAIFLTGGGVSKAFEITSILKSIPTPVWIVVGVIVMIRLFGGKRK